MDGLVIVVRWWPGIVGGDGALGVSPLEQVVAGRWVYVGRSR